MVRSMSTKCPRIVIAAAAAAFWLAPVVAQARAHSVTVLGVSGDGGADISAQLEQGMAELYELVDGAIYKTAAQQLGRLSASPEDVAEVARRQRIDAIVAGATLAGERLRVIVRDGGNGEVVARNVYPLHRGRLAPETRDAIIRDLVEALDRAVGVPRPYKKVAPASRPQQDDDVTIERTPPQATDDEPPPLRRPPKAPVQAPEETDDEPKRNRDVDDETPPLPKRQKSDVDDEAPPLPKRHKSDSDDETPPRAKNDVDDEEPPLPHRKRTKMLPDEGDDQPTAELHKRKPVTPPGNGLEIGVGIGLLSRSLSIDAPGATPYKGGAVAAFRFDAAIFPFAWSRAIRFAHPALATFGLAVSWVEALPFSSLNAAGTETTPGHARRYRLALLSRIPFGSASRPSLAISTGVGSIDYSADDPAMLGVPNVGYHHVDFGLALEIPFGTPRVSLGLSGSILALFDAGAIGSAEQYGAGSGWGGDGAVTFTVRPAKWLWLRAAARYTSMSLSFDGSGAHFGTGARDNFFDGVIEVGYSG
jgi:hypothetical protein